MSALLGWFPNVPVAVGSIPHALSSDIHNVACLLWDEKGRGGILIARLSLQWSFLQILMALRASQQLGEVSVLLLWRSGRFYLTLALMVIFRC